MKTKLNETVHCEEHFKSYEEISAEAVRLVQEGDPLRAYILMTSVAVESGQLIVALHQRVLDLMLELESGKRQ